MTEPTEGTAPQPEPFMPKTPQMGRLVQVSATTYVAELGNVPNPDFSGLLDEGKGQYASTEQQRSMLAKYDNPERRTRGLLPVFEEKHSLSEFAERFNQDLFETGSAVTAHLPNPRDRAKPQLNVMKQHALFPNLTEARKLAEEQCKKFDEYDVRTDRENFKKLRNSLDPSLRQTVDGLIPEEEKGKFFVLYWLQLVAVVQQHNLKYLQGIQKQIEELKPQAFPGENIKEYGKTILDLAETLTNAGRYPQELTSAVIDKLQTAGGSAGHVGRTIFQADVIQFRQKFNDKLETLGLKSDAEKEAEMVSC
jgi:hypothetical protein